MAFLKEDRFAKHIHSLIHQDTQQQEYNIDLTAGEIHAFAGPGSLDFGGSEFQPAKRQLITPQKKVEDDDYGWWNLPGGSYQVTMNEKMNADNTDNILGILVPHEHARQAGIISDNLLLAVEKEPQTITLNIQVPKAGCNIKENARIAALYLFEL